MADENLHKISVVQKTIIFQARNELRNKVNIKGEGNLIPDSKRSGLVVILEQILHEKFQRAGDDLILENKISFLMLLIQKLFYLTTIDKESFKLSLDSVIIHDYVKIIEEKVCPCTKMTL